MSYLKVQIEDKVSKLLEVLDKDIKHIEQNLDRLSQLRTLVVKRDNASLEELLNSIRADVKDYEENQTDRELIRQQLADILNCNCGQVTLSRLENIVSNAQKIPVAQCKSKLGQIVKKLAKEHKSTMMLLSDLSRFNRVLLNTIFQNSHPDDTTYNAAGTARQIDDAAFLSFQS